VGPILRSVFAKTYFFSRNDDGYGPGAARYVLALELAGPAASLELQQWARIAAVAHIDVDRVRRARHSLLMRGLDDPVPLPTTPRAAIKQTKDLIRFDELSSQELYIPWHLREAARIPEGANKVVLVITNLAQQLSVLERYERRALSRRKWAFRRFATEQRKSKLQLSLLAG
jgi:hypothetical protein